MAFTSSLSPRERLVFWGMTALSGASRFLAMARSLWDWDEALFCLGMRSYDVTLHHPHPPGFPVYIAFAKLLRLLIPSDFRALQAVNLIAGVLVFPAMVLLARELNMRFETSVVAAALFAFFPNVWFYGGTAFSDVPSIVVVIFAVVYLLRGRECSRDYWLGTLLLALAIGIRPQNLLVGLFPGAIATIRRPARDVLVALLIGAVVVVVAFGAAIYATGSYHDYMITVRAHAEYIAHIDSFRAPERPPLWRLFGPFFVKQYESPPLSIIVSLFVAISIVMAIRTRDRAMLYNFLIFGPFAISAWLMLDRFSINRFSIGYAPMFAIFAADGIARVSRQSRIAEAVIGGVIVCAFIVWTVPAFTTIRRDLAPPVQAVEATVRAVNPSTSHLFVDHSMTPFLEYLAPGFPFTRVLDDHAMPLTSTPNPMLLAEVSEPQGGERLFTRSRDRLWSIARRHYFVVELRPIASVARFGDGWYSPQQRGMDEWRWMSAHSVTTLPPARGDTLLRLNMSVPEELLAKRPSITVTLNGRVLERFRATPGDIVREYHVTPLSNANVLELSTDQTASDIGQPRALGLEVRLISWGPG